MNITTYNLKEIERQVIISCLNKHRTYSLKEIAVLLGISERTLYRKLEELGLQFGHVSKRPIIKSAN